MRYAKSLFATLLAFTLLVSATGCPQTCPFDTDMNGEFSIAEGINATDQLATELNLDFSGGLQDVQNIDQQIIDGLAMNPFIFLKYAPCVDILNNQFGGTTMPTDQMQQP